MKMDFVFREICIEHLSIVFMLSVLSCCSQKQGQEKTSVVRKENHHSFAWMQMSAVNKSNTLVHKYRLQSYREAAQIATLATVKVKTTFPEISPLQIPDFYYDFFNKEFVGPYELPHGDQNPNKTGTASGVIIAHNGYIITNYHVINTAIRIDIVLSDRRSYRASIVGVDKATDLALLKIAADNLAFVEFGNSDQTAVGDIALIVGNPLNFTSTVTQGIISYKARNIAHSKERWTLQSYLQTDGVVNIGNSGGALVDLSGRLIGIVTAIASPNGVYAGYSFAIPVEVVKKTADDLLNYGQVRRGSFGIKASEMDANKALDFHCGRNLCRQH